MRPTLALRRLQTYQDLRLEKCQGLIKSITKLIGCFGGKSWKGLGDFIVSNLAYAKSWSTSTLKWSSQAICLELSLMLLLFCLLTSSCLDSLPSSFPADASGGWIEK